MKTPILHVPKLADQEIVFHALYLAGYTHNPALDINVGWEMYTHNHAGHKEMSSVPYMYVDSRIRGTNLTYASWAVMGNLGSAWHQWLKVNSVSQMIRYLKAHKS